MKTGLYKLLILAAAVLLAGWALGCSSSSSGGGGGGGSEDAGADRGRTDGGGTDSGGGTDTRVTDTGTADIPVLDTGTQPDTSVTDTGGPDGSEISCSDIPATSNDGGDCTADASVCGDGACVSTDGVSAFCADPCVLAGSGLPACEGHCTTDEVCVGLTDSETGNPQTLPDGRQVGACISTAGDVGAYGECGADFCASGLQCVPDPRDSSPTAGTCLQECTDTCPTYEGLEQICALELTDASGNTVATVCVIECSEVTCPTGLVCVPLSGGSICMQPTFGG